MTINERATSVNRSENARTASTRTKFLRKVEILERWARDGAVPAGQSWPEGPVALRKWSQDSLGVEPWSSPNVASRGGSYNDLRERFDRAVKTLSRLGPSNNLTKAHAQARQLKVVNRSLRAQIFVLMQQIKYLKKQSE